MADEDGGHVSRRPQQQVRKIHDEERHSIQQELDHQEDEIDAMGIESVEGKKLHLHDRNGDQKESTRKDCGTEDLDDAQGGPEDQVQWYEEAPIHDGYQCCHRKST